MVAGLVTLHDVRGSLGLNRGYSATAFVLFVVRLALICRQLVV